MTAAPALPDVIEFAGKRFARAPRKRAGARLEPKPGFDGWFKPSVSGVLLLRPDGTPSVFASANDGGFMVSTHLFRGQVRYLFGTTDDDEAEFGLRSFSASRDAACLLLEQAGVKLRHSGMRLRH